MTDYKSPMVW